MSGTLRRKDHKHVLIFDYISKKVYKPAVENTMNPEIVVAKTGFKLKTGNNVPWATKMNILSSNPNYIDFVTDMARIQAEKGHKVLVVSDRVEFLEKCTEILDNSVLIIGTTKNRKELLNEVKSGEKEIINGSISIFKEGLSENHLSCLILANPISNSPLLEQLVGRIMREEEGKLTPIVVDIALDCYTGRTQLQVRENFYFTSGYKVTYI